MGTRLPWGGEKILCKGKAPTMENSPGWERLAALSPEPQLQLRLLHDCFLPYKTQSSSTKRTLLKVLE